MKAGLTFNKRYHEQFRQIARLVDIPHDEVVKIIRLYFRFIKEKIQEGRREIGDYKTLLVPNMAKLYVRPTTALWMREGRNKRVPFVKTYDFIGKDIKQIKDERTRSK